jgi:hypothetical protein
MHMLHRRRGLAASFLTIGLLAATLFTVDSLALPSSAEARCNGQGNPVTSTFSYGGAVRVSETPVTGTCNGNQTYSGVIKDVRADGYCVEVQFKETGIDWTIPSGGAVCGYGNTSSFEWRDRNSNSYVYQRFCIWPSSNPAVTTACGWGTGSSYGVNHGF